VTRLHCPFPFYQIRWAAHVVLTSLSAWLLLVFTQLSGWCPEY
jgi:hypothetical protein